jgi:hypothetical protein
MLWLRHMKERKLLTPAEFKQKIHTYIDKSALRLKKKLQAVKKRTEKSYV